MFLDADSSSFRLVSYNIYPILITNENSDNAMYERAQMNNSNSKIDNIFNFREAADSPR